MKRIAAPETARLLGTAPTQDVNAHAYAREVTRRARVVARAQQRIRQLRLALRRAEAECRQAKRELALYAQVIDPYDPARLLRHDDDVTEF